MSKYENQLSDSISLFLDNPDFVSFLLKAEPYLGMSSNSLREDLLNIILSNNFAFEMAVKIDDDFHFAFYKKQNGKVR